MPQRQDDIVDLVGKMVRSTGQQRMCEAVHTLLDDAP